MKNEKKRVQQIKHPHAFSGAALIEKSVLCVT
jgi:hypothetical protein